jgi:hypothetical protein
VTYLTRACGTAAGCRVLQHRRRHGAGAVHQHRHHWVRPSCATHCNTASSLTRNAPPRASARTSERKNCNLPGVVVDLPTITEKDTEDMLLWGVPNQIDFIAASFVRKGSDVSTIRRVLGKGGENVKIISKVENQEGLVNFDSILAESDGIMVARGDLGMEIPTEKIFLAQKMMISKSNAAGKPVVTATQSAFRLFVSPFVFTRTHVSWLTRVSVRLRA